MPLTFHYMSHSLDSRSQFPDQNHHKSIWYRIPPQMTVIMVIPIWRGVRLLRPVTYWMSKAFARNSFFEWWHERRLRLRSFLHGHTRISRPAIKNQRSTRFIMKRGTIQPLPPPTPTHSPHVHPVIYNPDALSTFYESTERGMIPASFFHLQNVSTNWNCHGGLCIIVWLPVIIWD